MSVEWLDLQRMRVIGLTLSCLLASGCSSVQTDSATIAAVPDSAEAPELYSPRIEKEYRIQLGDRLAIRSYYDPQLNQDVLVRVDGRIGLLLMGELAVVGMTPEELDKQITEAYSRVVDSPEVTVIVQESAASSIYLGGEVHRPAVQPLRGPITAFQAVTAAGGFLPSARVDSVVLLRKQPDGRFTAHKLDFDKVLRNQSQDIYLQRSDILYVPKTAIANVNQFVDQYINGVIPRNVLFSYQWTDVRGNNDTTLQIKQ